MKAWSIIWGILTLVSFIGTLCGNNWTFFLAIACAIMTVGCLVDDGRETQEN